jgi:hypothetical protein
MDPTLTTVFPTPLFPTYPSNRASINFAPALVLGYLFPRDAAQWRATADQISESAIWAGIHFRSDLEAARAIGEGVAQQVIERAKADGASAGAL